MKDGKMFFIVVPKGEAERAMNTLRECGAMGGTIVSAKGTASSSLLSILGFGESRREILLSMVDSSSVGKCLKGLDGIKAKGIAAVLGNDGGDEMESEKWTMVEIICEMGYADDCMAEARKAGAGGGTIIKGHGTAREDDVKFFGYPITGEKEVVVIVEKEETAKRIVEAVSAMPLLSKKGKAVVFSLPVSHFKALGDTTPHK